MEVESIEANTPTLGFLLHDVARLLKKRFEQNSRDSGLTRSQWQVLAYLAELLDIEPITLGRIVDKLEGLGLIERFPHPSDRRVWILNLTPAARPKLEQVRKLGDLTRGEALDGVSQADCQRLVKTLMKLKKNLTEACDSPAARLKRTGRA
jgi:MarR family transcriptional regulator for hemolysin